MFAELFALAFLGGGEPTCHNFRIAQPAIVCPGKSAIDHSGGDVVGTFNVTRVGKANDKSDLSAGFGYGFRFKVDGEELAKFDVSLFARKHSGDFICDSRSMMLPQHQFETSVSLLKAKIGIEYPNCRGNVGCRLGAVVGISHGYFQSRTIFQFVLEEINSLDVERQPGPYLRLADLTSVAGHVLSGQEGSPNIVDSNGRNKRHQAGYNQHPQRPPGHIPLGYKIALGAFMLIGGFYYATYAFRLGNTVKPGTGAAYLLFGMVSIGIGVGLILTGIYPQ